MPQITFKFEKDPDIVLQAPENCNLLDFARQSGIAIDAPCSGNGTCGKCRVRLLEGNPVSDPTHHLSKDEQKDGWRLACGTTVTGDITVFIPASASAFKTGIRTADLSDPSVLKAFNDLQEQLSDTGFSGNPAVFSEVISMDEPSLDDTMPDNERLSWAIAAQTGVERVSISFNALKKLALVLRESAFNVRCVLLRKAHGLEVLDIFPGDDAKHICGLAIDIGTTTVSAVLLDIESGEILAKASAGNGQIRYGADVINRIIESTRPGGRERLRRAVAEETLVPLIDNMCRSIGLGKDRIYRVCIAGNTTMSHLVMGLYSDPVRMEPFVPSFFQCDTLRAVDVIPGLPTCAALIMAPNVGSYVGGDITAGMFASMLWNSSDLTLFIDLGTNGEIVLGNEEYMMTCACSAGPAFEGGDISCGMRATDGAVEEVHIDKETMEPTLVVIGEPGQKPVGLCGSGIIDMTASLYLTGIINPKGKFVREGRRVKHDEHGMGRYVFAFEDESADGRELAINEVDLDNFIRAKGAIFSAILLMLNQLGITPQDIQHIQIAGGIGSAIDFENAVKIGMFPDIPRDVYSYIGNSSLSGAYAMLRSVDAEKKVSELSRNMMYVELSNEPTYMDEFVSACFLPHTNSSLFPSVGGI